MHFVNIFLDHLTWVLLENYVQFYWHLIVLSLANFVVLLASFFHIILHGHGLQVLWLLTLSPIILHDLVNFMRSFFWIVLNDHCLWFLYNFIDTSHIILHHRCLQILWNLLKSSCMIFACECNFIDIFSYYLYDYCSQTLYLLDLLVLVNCLFPNAWMCKLVHLSFYLLVLVCDFFSNALRCKLIHSSSYWSCIQQHWTWLW
jgi:hypothetical protein